ncbi:tetratricopeptide repeat protein [Lentzea sp. NPDC102401]|uniref:tetratricopeptide repeat protein n=1 Tax=Lentzea sp. NPDC102401 TaxID=3364128 RepID=UPI0037F75294
MPTQVLVGSGGTGKTQLAATIAYHTLNVPADARDLIVWVTAVSRDAIQSMYAEAARRLALLGADGTDVVRDAEVLLSWLTTSSRSWLVVLDDITDLHDVDGLWPRGASARGHVIATTRRKDPTLTGGGRKVIEVRTFTPTESSSYLTTRLSQAGFGHLLDQSVPELAHTLGYLPLALSHAAAYMLRKQRLTCADYLARYREQYSSLRDLLPAWADTEAYGRPVTVTLTLGLAAADSATPVGGARAVLRAAALLDPAGHPMRFWETRSMAGFVSELIERNGANATVTSEDLWDLCLELNSYGLLQVDPSVGDRAISMHAVTARAVRESIDSDEFPIVVAAVADGLAELWPQRHYLDPHLISVLRPNVDALWLNATDQIWKLGRYRLLLVAGDSLFDAGLQTAAVGYWKRISHSAAEFLGPHHPDVFTARAQVGRAQGHAGDPAAAVQTLRAVVAQQVEVLGTEHPDTLASSQDLARWKGHAGDPRGAVADTNAVLEVRRRVLGPQHPDTLASRMLLARWRGETGNATLAAEELSELLQEMLAELGSDHPAVLKTRNSLAYWRGEAGDAAGAAQALEGLLEDHLRILGTDHQESLKTRNNMAYWRGEAGDSAGAVLILERLLGDRLRILGPDHPQTLASRSNLAYWRGKSGEVRAAASEFRALLEDRIRVLGHDHIDTLDTRANLARWSGEADGSSRIAVLFEELLADRLRVLGPDHPDTLTTRHEVARWRGHGGDPEAAVLGLTEVLPDRVRVLGWDHPDTLATRHEIARWQGEAGRHSIATVGLTAVLTDRLNILGPKHPHTLVTFAELGRWREAEGDLQAAVDAWETAYHGRLQVLGSEHPDTLLAQRQLLRLRKLNGSRDLD